MASGNDIRRLRGKIPAAKVAELIGVNVDRLRKWEERDTDPSDSGDIEKVERYFGLPLDKLSGLNHFEFVKYNSTGGKNKESQQSINALQSLADGNKVLYEANRTLADSNKNLSEANKKLADAHFILAEGNRELITIFKDFISKGFSLPEAMKTQFLPADPGTNRGSEGFRPAASGKTKNAGR